MNHYRVSRVERDSDDEKYERSLGGSPVRGKCPFIQTRDHDLKDFFSLMIQVVVNRKS